MLRDVKSLVSISLLLATAVALSCDPEPAAEPVIRLDVFAASSLAEGFSDLEQAFEAAHPGVDVRLNLAGSQVLRLQIEQGASADLFASANHAHLRALLDQRLVEDPQVVAHNRLVVITPASGSDTIQDVADLTRASRLVIGTNNVPIGIYARQMLARSADRFGEDFPLKVLSRVVSEESNARLVRAKVELGEADAAIVYQTDAQASEDLRVIRIPTDINPLASYPVGVVTGSNQPALAASFIQFARSTPGRRVLAQHGFVTGDE